MKPRAEPEGAGGPKLLLLLQLEDVGSETEPWGAHYLRMD